MSRVFAFRIAIALVLLAAFFVVWSLFYELIVAWRWNPAIPSEGTSRWALLKVQNANRSLSSLLTAWNHFSDRLAYPPTRGETIVRGLIAAGVTLAVGGGLALVSFIVRKPTHHGNARFGNLIDAEKKNLLAKKHGLLLGKLNGATIASDDPSHVLVVGPTRSGKGVSFVIPNGYTWQGSSVWFDPKRENYDAFAVHRKSLGDEVFFFSPGERKTHRFNPLDYIRRDSAMSTDASVVASFIVPEGTGSGEIWSRAGRQLLAAMIGYVVSSPRYEGQRHLRSVTRLTATGVDFLRVLTNIRENEEKYLPTWVVQGMNQFIALEKETRNSAFFNVTAALNPWTNDLVAAATSTTDFDISQLRKKPMAIFIGCSVAQLEVFRPIIKILVQQIHDVLMASMPGADEPLKVLMMIDEFRQLGKMDALVSKLTINAGYGFRMVLILQDLAQLDELYGKATRQTTLSACQVKLFIRINDQETSEYVSDMLGSTTIEVRTPIIRAGQGIFGGRDKSVNYQERRLRTADELRQMNSAQAIVLVPNAPGFMVKKIVYYKDAPYRAIYRALEGRSVAVPSLDVWKDANLRAMDEIRARAANAATGMIDLVELRDTPAEPGYATATPPIEWADKVAKPVSVNSAASPQEDGNASEPVRQVAESLPSAPSDAVSVEDAKPADTAEVVALRPKSSESEPAKPAKKRLRKAKGGLEAENEEPSPVVRRSFARRETNNTTGLKQFLASLDEEVETSAGSLGDGGTELEAQAAVKEVKKKVRSHGDRRSRRKTVDA